MGTINYGTSKYITLGINLNNYEYDETEMSYEEMEYLKQEDIDLGYTEAKEILDKYSFEHFNVSLEYGYYEGFYLNIDPYFDWCLDSYKERHEYNAEVTEIKKLLLELTEIGLVSVYPGWCTGYADISDTNKDINVAIRQMRKEVKSLMTYNQWKRSGKTFEEMFV